MQGESAGKMFKESRDSLKPRPWAVDTLDELLARFADRQQGPHRKALLLCDNAGSDVVLGMLPLARELLQRGTQVRIAVVDVLTLRRSSSSAAHPARHAGRPVHVTAVCCCL